MTSVKEIFADTQKNKRVYALPQKLQQDFDSLPDKKFKDAAGWEPALPLIVWE